MNNRFDKTDDKQIEQLLVRKAKLIARRNDRNLNVNVGMIALLGSIIICPIVAGIFIGEWLDIHHAIEGFSWRLNLLLIGFIFGLYLGYKWIKYEGIDKIDNEYKKLQTEIDKEEEK